MTSKSKCLKVSKALVNLSLNEHGKVSDERVVEIIAELKKQSVSKSLPILRNFYSLIKQKISSYEGHLEKSDSKNNTQEIISESISKTQNAQINIKTSENNSLIAGFRLRIGDDVFEDSIANRISRLKKSLN